MLKNVAIILLAIFLIEASFSILRFSPAGEKDSIRDRSGNEFFEKKIRPVLIKHCYECHSADAKRLRGGLRLDSRAATRRGGESGPAVVPGKVDESLLIDALRYDGLEMPPKERLSKMIVADFVKWIELGAPDTRDDDAPVVTKNEIDLEKARQFWAFQPPRSSVPPTVSDDAWPMESVDRFVLAALDRNGLNPVHDADRRTWLRRVTFDLTGLPPLPDEIHGYLNDASPDAASRVIDRLLASPRFGEHWGRHWLDIARYADSNGGDINLTFHNAWRYRDYVVNSLNNDKPYDQFIIEQLAGDLLSFENDAQRTEQITASGFLVVGPKMLSERDKEKLHMDVVDEQLDSIGRVFLGLTIGCARCHDHKFDPIPTRDYYALAGILRSTITVRGIRMGNVNVSGWIERALPISPAHKSALDEYKKKVDELTKQIKTAKATLLTLTVNAKPSPESLAGIVVDDLQATQIGDWTKSTHVPRYVGQGYVHDNNEQKGNKQITFTPDLPKAGKYEVRIAFASTKGRATNVPVAIRHAAGKTAVVLNQEKLPSINSLFEPVGQYEFEAGTKGNVTISTGGTTSYVIADAVQFLPVNSLRKNENVAKQTKPQPIVDKKTRELKLLEQRLANLKKNAPPPAPFAMAAQDRESPSDCEICIRGEPHNRGESVPRGFLTVIDSSRNNALNPQESGRVQLARWIASADNPLTSRVMVNRIWHHLFGTGLVRSVDNFGELGERPSHRKLLDELSVDFVDTSWSVKNSIRKIASSRVYRLSSRHDARSMANDPQVRLLWRHQRRRLTAESIRDAMLQTSGLLDLKTGASSVIGLGEQAIANNPNDKTGQLSVDASARRSIYLPLVRNNLPDVLTVFDLADPDVVVGARSITTVPAQALLLLNSETVRRLSRALAARALDQFESDDRDRLKWIYATTIGRLPSDSEITRALDYIHNVSDDAGEPISASQAWSEFCHALLASTEFRYVE